jgi:hypothetical protein
MVAISAHPSPAARADSSLPVIFLRGDANQDSRVDIADATTTLLSLFFAPLPLPCADAADADDSGRLDIADPIRTLNFLFLGHGQPAQPFPTVGTDPTSDGLTCDAPPAGDLDPPRPLAAEDLNALLDREEPQALSLLEGAIAVNAEVFDLLSSLAPGESLVPHANAPGMREYMDQVLALMPPEGTPVAIPHDLVAPTSANGCYTIDPAKLAGRSGDTGPEPTPSEGLRFAVTPETICGFGSHVVAFTVTDANGLSSTAAATVTLCDPAGTDCNEKSSPPVNSPPASPATRTIYCHWIVDQTRFPTNQIRHTRGVHYDADGNITRVDTNRRVRAGRDALEFSATQSGPGPNHVLIAARFSPGCETPTTDLALFGWGDATLRLNLICTESNDCTIVLNPGCGSRVDVEGSYEGIARIRTEAGATCKDPANRIEALAAEETDLQVNGSSLFQKGLAIQSGNRIQKQVSFELAGTLGVGPGWIAPEVRVSHGVTHEVWQETGGREARLRAFGSRSFEPPVTARLAASGKAEILAEGSANGLAGAATEAAAVYTFGISNCPGAGTVFLVEVSGRGEALARARDAMAAFLHQRTGR